MVIYMKKFIFLIIPTCLLGCSEGMDYYRQQKIAEILDCPIKNFQTTHENKSFIGSHDWDANVTCSNGLKYTCTSRFSKYTSVIRHRCIPVK